MGRLDKINEEYGNKDKKPYYEGAFRSLFTNEFPEWRPKESDNFVKILPPVQDDIYFGLEIWLHDSVGADRDRFLCPKKMKEILTKRLMRKQEDLPKEIADGRCPICEDQARMIKDLKGETYKGNNEIISLFPDTRTVFMIIDDKDDDTRAEGVQVWSAPTTKVNKDQILNLCKIKRGERAGETIDISLPENEYTVAFTREGKTKEKTSYGGFSLEKSELTIEEVKEYMKLLPDKFEDILNFASYEEIRLAYEGIVSKPDSSQTKEAEKVEVPRRRTSESETSRRDIPVKGEKVNEEDDRERIKRELREKIARRRTNRDED